MPEVEIARRCLAPLLMVFGGNVTLEESFVIRDATFLPKFDRACVEFLALWGFYKGRVQVP